MPRLALFLIFTAPLTYSQQTCSESIPLEPLPIFSGSNAFGSTYVSFDSWIYPAFDRLGLIPCNRTHALCETLNGST
jgi:hypothetical protein